MQNQTITLSRFSSLVNHPICEYIETVVIPQNSEYTPLHFLSGDASKYQNPKFTMPQQGYEILRKHASQINNHGYTLSSGLPPAREAILKLYKPKFQLDVRNVTIQHGVNQGLFVLLMSFTNPGDEILIPEIGYPIFEKLAPSLGVTTKYYKLKPQSGFQIDIPHLQTLLTPKTQFIFIINPSNPMGTIFTLQHMQQIIKFCDKNELPIVCDQVYHGEAFAERTYHSFGDVTDDVPVIVLSGVQKILSVPGWCTSWTVIFDKHKYLANINKNIQTCGMIFLHSNKFTQVALPQILQKVGLFTQEPIKEVQSICDLLCNELSTISGFKPIKAHGTFYMSVLIDVQKFNVKSDIQFAKILLSSYNVAVMPLSVFGKGSTQGFRMLTCGLKQIYTEFIDRLRKFAASQTTQI